MKKSTSSYLAEKETENFELSERIEELESDLRATSITNKELEKKIKGYEDYFLLAISEIGGLNERIEKLEKQKKELLNEKSVLEVERDRFQTDYDELFIIQEGTEKKQIADLQGEKRTLEIEKKNEISRLNIDYQEQIRILKEELSETNEIIEKYKNDLGNYYREIEERNEQLLQGSMGNFSVDSLHNFSRSSSFSTSVVSPPPFSIRSRSSNRGSNSVILANSLAGEINKVFQKNQQFSQNFSSSIHNSVSRKSSMNSILYDTPIREEKGFSFTTPTNANADSKDK